MEMELNFHSGNDAPVFIGSLEYVILRTPCSTAGN